MPDIVNVEQAAAWDGPQGARWTEREAAHNTALAAHTERLLEVADVEPVSQVLDVGCGTGETTRACARRATEGRVLGVDLSSEMLRLARVRAAEDQLTNVDFEQADAQVHRFRASGFDLLISRFGVMFFADPRAAFANLARATAPGGRLAMIVWQDFTRNEWAAVPRATVALGRRLPPVPAGVPGAFGLADPDHARAVLEGAGFAEVRLDDVAAPFHLGRDADDATEFAREMSVVRGALDGLDADETARAIDALHHALAARASAAGVVLDSRTWVITAVR